MKSIKPNKDPDSKKERLAKLFGVKPSEIRKHWVRLCDKCNRKDCANKRGTPEGSFWVKPEKAKLLTSIVCDALCEANVQRKKDQDHNSR